MATGKVKWFDPKKGYGFIVGENEQDVFVHYSSISGEGFRALKDGEVVQYDLVTSDKGLQAHNVNRVASPLPAEPSGQSAQA
ncbi:MAG: cold shock domain-containing protein [Planctomycetaceae bacterium]|nr:cold shock domain-containing protein [Planctomycetaceae bacterium]